MTAVIKEAYIQGVSTRSVDDLVKAMGMTGVSKSQVSRLCVEIDERVEAFLDRPLEGEWPYVWLDATYIKVRRSGRIVTVTADGANDTRRCHTAIIDRQAIPIIPIRKNGRPRNEDCPAAIARNETLRATRHYCRAFWKRWTGYHARSRIEAKMRCLKAFGKSIAARHPDSQTAEIQIRVALVNRFNALGTAEIVRVS